MTSNRRKVPTRAGLVGALVLGLVATGSAPALAQTNALTPFTSYHESTVPGTGLNAGVWYMYVRAGEQFKIDLRVPDDKYSRANHSDFDPANPVTVHISSANGDTQTNSAWRDGASGSKDQLGYQPGSGEAGDWATATAADEGVWRIEVVPGKSASSSNWNDEARLMWSFGVRDAAGNPTPGSRVWTEAVDIGQTKKTSGSNAGYDFWSKTGWKGDAAQTAAAQNLILYSINEYGQQYQVRIPDANGVNSRYSMNSMGVVESGYLSGGSLSTMNLDEQGNCIAVPLSVPARDESNTEVLGAGGRYGGKQARDFMQVGDGLTPLASNGDACPNMSEYLLSPAPLDAAVPAVMPAQTNQHVAIGTPIRPTALENNVTDLAFDRATGKLRGKITGQPARLTVRLGADGGVAGFDPSIPVITRQVDLLPDQSVQDLLTWDVKDGSGNPIAVASNLKITISGAWAPIHVVRTDMEDSRGGLIISPLDASGVVGSPLPLHWNDEKLGTLVSGGGTYGTSIGALTSSGSDGSRHAWATVAPNDGWGNKRAINDWAQIQFADELLVPGLAPDPDPRLQIDKSQVGEPSLSADRNAAVITWDITVKNTASAAGAATNTVVEDVLPAGATNVVQVSATQGSFDPVAGRWSIGTLPGGGDSQTLRLRATVPMTGTTPVKHVNRAVVGSAEIEAGPKTGPCQLTTNVDADDDRCDEVETTVSGSKPAWDVAKSSNPASGSKVGLGQDIVYTLTVRNSGDVPIDGTKLVDDLSKVLNNATFKGAAPSGSVLSGTTLTWAVPTVPVGEQRTLSYTVTVKQSAADVLLNNSVHGVGTPSTGDPQHCTEAQPCETRHPTPKWPNLTIPVLGASVSPMILGSGVVLLVLAAGTAAVAARQRGKRSSRTDPNGSADAAI